MPDDAIIPPVRAGSIESELTVDYGDSYGKSFTATGEHNWTFDLFAYADITGLDEGPDYPYVAQANGHTLRIETDYTWNHRVYNGEERNTLSFEEVAYRGTTRRETVYWTRCGYYDLDPSLKVTRVGNERQQYKYRERAEKDIPHKKPYDLSNYTAYDGEQMVRKLHTGVLGPTVGAELAELIEMDSPDHAVRYDEYQHPNTEDSPTPADD